MGFNTWFYKSISLYNFSSKSSLKWFLENLLLKKIYLLLVLLWEKHFQDENSFQRRLNMIKNLSNWVVFTERSLNLLNRSSDSRSQSLELNHEHEPSRSLEHIQNCWELCRIQDFYDSLTGHDNLEFLKIKFAFLSLCFYKRLSIKVSF